MKIQVSTKVAMHDWGFVRTSATVSENPFFGFNEPDEPEFLIEEFQARDSRNKVIHGRSIFEKNMMVHGLEDWELSILEEKLILKFIEEKAFKLDAMTDEMIETVRAYF